MAVRKEGPDQLRSWAIALAACVINTLLSGISRTTGIFYVALIETYGVSRMQANLPFTIRNVVRNLGGPLVGAIGQRYGARDVTIIGGVFASLGITLCTFAPDIIWITILWGGMHGFGVALGNTLFSVIVTQYFLKYRATASGLAISGACVGSFILPVLLEYMLTHLGLSATFLITGGLILHVLPASIMMKEPPWVRREADRKKQIVAKLDEAHSRTVTLSNKVPKPPQLMSMIQEESNGHPVHSNDIPPPSSKNESQSSGNLGPKQVNKETSCPTVSINRFSGLDNNAYEGSKSDLSGNIIDQTPEDIICRERLRTISIGGVSMTISAPSPEVEQETSLSKGILILLRDPMFHMISLSLAAFAMLFDPAITVVVDYLLDKGFKEDVAKYYIIMLSLGDMVGRLGFGWVTDKKYLSVSKFMMLLQTFQGVCFLLLPFIYAFDALMAVIVVYGIMSGATLVMFPILIGTYLQSVQSLAIGCSSFLSGLLSFAIPPLIGYFRDRIGSYDGMFLITGALSLVIGLLWLLEPMLMKLRTRLKLR